MPYVSQSQRRFFYGQLPELAQQWERHTPKGTKLPERVASEERAKEAGIPSFLARNALPFLLGSAYPVAELSDRSVGGHIIDGLRNGQIDPHSLIKPLTAMSGNEALASLDRTTLVQQLIHGLNTHQISPQQLNPAALPQNLQGWLDNNHLGREIADTDANVFAAGFPTKFSSLLAKWTAAMPGIRNLPGAAGVAAKMKPFGWLQTGGLYKSLGAGLGMLGADRINKGLDDTAAGRAIGPSQLTDGQWADEAANGSRWAAPIRGLRNTFGRAGGAFVGSFGNGPLAIVGAVSGAFQEPLQGAKIIFRQGLQNVQSSNDAISRLAQLSVNNPQAASRPEFKNLLATTLSDNRGQMPWTRWFNPQANEIQYGQAVADATARNALTAAQKASDTLIAEPPTLESLRTLRDRLQAASPQVKNLAIAPEQQQALSKGIQAGLDSAKSQVAWRAGLQTSLPILGGLAAYGAGRWAWNKWNEKPDEKKKQPVPATPLPAKWAVNPKMLPTGAVPA